MRVEPRALWLLTLLLVSRPDVATAWGKDGHAIVCEIAWRQLTPQSQALVKELRAADPQPGASFADSCDWADDARRTTHRHTAEYHYINIPKGVEGVDLERDCPAYDCLPIAIRRYASYLACKEATKCSARRRAEALKLLAHFVGDAHQPLHAGYPDDRGGNDIDVRWFDQIGDDFNLHRVWDDWLLRRAGLTYPDAVPELMAELAAEETGPWHSLDVSAWLDESYGLAVGYAYALPDDRALGPEYLERTSPIVRQQLKKAGIRLAYLINRVAAGELD